MRASTERLQALHSDKDNPVRNAPLDTQAAVNAILLAHQSLQYNFSVREDAHMYIAAYSEPIRPVNVKLREQYGA